MRPLRHGKPSEFAGKGLEQLRLETIGPEVSNGARLRSVATAQRDPFWLKRAYRSFAWKRSGPRCQTGPGCAA